MHRTIQRLRSEFLEMPGLRLTNKQVQRLCGIDEETCKAVLDALVHLEFLRLNSDNTYSRLTDDLSVRPRPATMTLPPRRRQAS
jgi:hypothetical protein